MNLTDIQVLQSLLNKHGVWAKKKLGQNFLINPQVLNTIIDASLLSPQNTVVEVGSGTGVLTQELVQHVRHVHGIEIDRSILGVLQEVLSPFKNIYTIHQQSALDFVPSSTPYTLVGNIPYYITSPLLRHFLWNVKQRPERIVFLLQKEVAQKICASPQDQSILSLSVTLFGSPEIISFVPSADFFPRPKVDSAVLRITPYSSPLLPEHLQKTFWNIAKQTFSQKRKKIKTTFPSLLQKSSKEISPILTQLDIDPNIRPQALSIPQWNRLCEYVNANTLRKH